MNLEKLLDGLFFLGMRYQHIRIFADQLNEIVGYSETKRLSSLLVPVSQSGESFAPFGDKLCIQLFPQHGLVEMRRAEEGELTRYDGFVTAICATDSVRIARQLKTKEWPDSFIPAVLIGEPIVETVPERLQIIEMDAMRYWKIYEGPMESHLKKGLYPAGTEVEW